MDNQEAIKFCKHLKAKGNKKNCKFPAIINSDYCCYHQPDLIPCPIDPKHSIQKQNLDKHMLICPKAKDKIQLMNSNWYQQNINVNQNKESFDESNMLKQVEEQTNYQQQQEQISQKKKKILQKLFNEKSQVLETLISKIEKGFKAATIVYHAQLVKILKNYSYSLQQLEEYLLDEGDQSIMQPNEQLLIYNKQQQTNNKDILQQQDKNITDTKKDLIQAELLVELLKENNLLCSENCFVEFGAGRGILSHFIAEALKPNFAGHILIERESRRHKFDKHQKLNPYYLRFRTDILDFNINQTEELLKQKEYPGCSIPPIKIVGVSKHMCGGATDLSLNTLLNCKQNCYLQGFMIATCCHQLCDQKSYLNIDFLKNIIGLQEQEIDLFFLCSSWYVSGSIIKYNNSEEQNNKLKQLQKDQYLEQQKEVEENKEQLNSLTKSQTPILNSLFSDQRSRLGKMCKRIIDIGRVLFMQNQGKNTILKKYCSQVFTPENFVIITI